jgi:5'-nucleotidase
MSRSYRRALIAVVLVAGLIVAWPAIFSSVGAFAAPAITFAHINDVYEIDPIEGGSYGGMARVATLFDRLRRAGPLVTTLGGDFLSPSAIGTARVNGEPLFGKQMVDVMNEVGLGFATLGNHEFDIPESAFRARMAEAKFKVVISNAVDASGAQFSNTVDTAIAPIKIGSRIVRIGFIGLVLDYNRKPWVKYLPPIETAKAKVAQLGGKVDVIVALTHQAAADDEKLVEAIPEIDLVLGGHEHENWYVRRGRSFATLVKADANARSVAVVTMRVPQGLRPDISVRFELINSSLPMQPRAQAIIKRWMDTGLEALRHDGFAPEAVVAVVPFALDGRDMVVRHQSGDLTTLIARAIRRETGADIGLLNGGTIRIDDVLPAGPIRQYDIFRILPFGGTVVRATMDGATLKRVLEIGNQNVGIGGFLHPFGIALENGTWVVGGKPLDPAAKYSVGMPEFLLTGGETRLDFLSSDNPQLSDVRVFRDIRRVVMDELQLFGRGGGLKPAGFTYPRQSPAGDSRRRAPLK